MQHNPINPKTVILSTGQRIKELRKELKLSQAKLALECDMDTSALQRLEWGKTNPTLKTITVICNALKISIIDFFSGVKLFDETKELNSEK